MEMNHIERIEELQGLYERKIFIENSNYLQLEQKMLENDKLHAEEVKKLELANEKNISAMEEEYKKHLDLIVQEFEDSKKTADGLKMMYEEKLTQ